jgi:hypothetical protein
MTGDGPFIGQAGRYLVKVLVDRGSVAYSDLFDGTDESNDRLGKTMGFEDDWYDPFDLLKKAVKQMRQQWFVTVQQLDSELSDGSRDFIVELTDVGRQRIASRDGPVFY